MATVIMAIHNDNQLPAGQFRKAAHTEGIRFRQRPNVRYCPILLKKSGIARDDVG
jgi:hypothetical protein